MSDSALVNNNSFVIGTGREETFPESHFIFCRAEAMPAAIFACSAGNVVGSSGGELE